MNSVLRTTAVLILAQAFQASAADTSAATTQRFAYLPPRLTKRVVFYHSFEQGYGEPEINRIGAEVKGFDSGTAAGINGNGYRCPTQKTQSRYSIHSPALCPHRPLTVMAWWRLDRPMTLTTGFNVLTLHGKGLLGSFVRGKGSWCALPEPRRVFQVYYFEGIANRNDVYSERIFITEPSWHHTAITVSGAAEIAVYWDSERKTTYTIRGRPFQPGDIKQLCVGLRGGSQPMTIDDVVVLDYALSTAELTDYVTSVKRLSEIDFPTLLPEAR